MAVKKNRIASYSYFVWYFVVLQPRQPERINDDPLVHVFRNMSGGTARGSQGLAKRILLLCSLVTISLTLNMLPHLGSILDNGQMIINEKYLFDTLVNHSIDAKIQNSDSDCFVHMPMKAAFDHVENPNKSLETLQLPTPRTCGSLRRNWDYMPVQSVLAREFEKHQTNCDLPVMSYTVDNAFGLGSHLVLWSQALCNAMEKGYRLRATNAQWLWMDKMYCDPSVASLSPLLCYFPKAEFRCDNQRDVTESNETMADPRDRRTFCKRLREGDTAYINQTLPKFRAATMEYMFQRISPLVIKEAERQVGLLFGETTVEDLITVHVRWGDKFWEMDLAPIHEYIAAVKEILKMRKQPSNSIANIYLASEDPKAVEAFLEAAPDIWNIYVDRTYVELTPYRPSKGNRASWAARNTNGRAGLVALGSLLVAMEANDYILTTSSNWSRLMNALRRNVIDPRCGNCTRAIDLRPGNW